MRYKYKVGDRVLYKTLDVTESVCDKCGHVDDIYTDVVKGGGNYCQRERLLFR